MELHFCFSLEVFDKSGKSVNLNSNNKPLYMEKIILGTLGFKLHLRIKLVINCYDFVGNHPLFLSS